MRPPVTKEKPPVDGDVLAILMLVSCLLPPPARGKPPTDLTDGHSAPGLTATTSHRGCVPELRAGSPPPPGRTVLLHLRSFSAVPLTGFPGLQQSSSLCRAHTQEERLGHGVEVPAAPRADVAGRSARTGIPMETPGHAAETRHAAPEGPLVTVASCRERKTVTHLFPFRQAFTSSVTLGIV